MTKIDPGEYRRLELIARRACPTGDADSLHEAYLELNTADPNLLVGRARNRSIDFRRRENRQRRAENYWASQYSSSIRSREIQQDPLTRVADEEQDAVLRQIVCSLPEYEHHLAHSLSDQITVAEIASLHSVSIAKIYTDRDRLRRTLARHPRLAAIVHHEGGSQ